MNFDALIGLIIWLGIAVGVLYVCWWGLGKLQPGEPWNKICTIALVIATVIVAIYFS